MAHDHTAGGNHHRPTASDPRPEARRRQTRVLWLALGINSVLLVAEAIGGFVFGSLALLADAAHMLSDVAGLAIALVAQALMERPRSARHTFGLRRAEALGAQANGALLLASVGWIVFEAIRRIGDPPEVAGVGLLIVATLGLVVNVGSAIALARVRGDNLNVEGAYAHMLADAAGSVGAIVAGIAVTAFSALWVDPAVSILIAGLVLYAAWGLIRDTARILLEGAPRDLDATEINGAIAAHGGVEDVHHLHLWSISSDLPALSAHVVLRGEMDLHQAQAHGDAIREMLAERFGINHVTLELECHTCEPETAVVSGTAAAVDAEPEDTHA